MPEYQIGDHTLRRKNFYHPCALGPRLEQATDDEYVRLMKAASWADNITNGEWPVVLGHDDATKANRYRLKKKAAGWLMALARIAVLNPELFKTIADQAREMYADQVGEKYPWSNIALPMAGLRRPGPGEDVVLFIAPGKDGHDDDDEHHDDDEAAR